MPEVFRFKEQRDSRGGTLTPPREVRRYVAAGSTDEDFVRSYAASTGTPVSVTHPRGVLWRQDISIEKEGHAIFRVEVPYAPNRSDSGQYRIRFDTTGGTVRIFNSLETINKYTRPNQAAAPDMGGAINVRGDQVDGTEIVIPALKLDVEFTHPPGVMNLARIKNLGRWTGRYNTTPFLTFAAGEVLFLGATGEEGPDVESAPVYQFACSENSTGQTIGDIANVDKKGWEHAWIRWEDAVAGGLPTKRPKHVYVERVYKGIDMAAVLGFGA